MKKLDQYAILTELDEDIIVGTMPPSWQATGVLLPKKRGSGAGGRFFENGWVIAACCTLVSAAVLGGVMWLGRQEPAVPPAHTDTESENDSTDTERMTESETIIETEVNPLLGSSSTDPYTHPLNASVKISLIDGRGTPPDPIPAYMVHGDLFLADKDTSGTARRYNRFTYPRIDGHYLSYLAPREDLTTVRVPDASELEIYMLKWSGSNSHSVSYTIYNEDCQLIDTPLSGLSDGVYYVLVEIQVRNGYHRIDGALYTAYGYALYQVPIRLIIGDTEFVPPEEPPLPFDYGTDIQSEFSAACFTSNHDGTCSFVLADIQRKQIVSIPSISPTGDRVTEILSCQVNLRDSTVIVPDSVIRIGSNVFNKNTNLKAIMLGSGVAEIADYAFMGCHMLESVSLPEGLIRIGVRAFEDCGQIKSIRLPDSLEVLDRQALGGINITSLTLPASLKYIGERALITGDYADSFYYLGTMREWEAITKEDAWDTMTEYSLLHCTDGDIWMPFKEDVSATGP